MISSRTTRALQIIAERGPIPSAELAAATGISTSSLAGHLKHCVNAGVLSVTKIWCHGSARGWANEYRRGPKFDAWMLQKGGSMRSIRIAPRPTGSGQIAGPTYYRQFARWPAHR